MKRVFKNYAIIWVILFIIYNVVLFSIRPIAGFSITYDARFWLSWAFVAVAFIGQLVCGYISFKEERLDKLFLNVSIVSLAYRALILMVVVSTVLMFIPNCPLWVATIACVVIFGFSVVAIIETKTAADLVNEVGEKVKAKTEFIRLLTVDAESLMNKVTTDEEKKQVKEVYEKLRYSDPMSNDSLEVLNSQISNKYNEFKETVLESKETTSLKKELVDLLDERNKKCKALK